MDCRHTPLPDRGLSGLPRKARKRDVVFSWVFLFYSRHPAIRPSGQLRCSGMLLHTCGQAKEKHFALCRRVNVLASRTAV
jgi:hypothetical protein